MGEFVGEYVGPGLAARFGKLLGAAILVLAGLGLLGWIVSTLLGELNETAVRGGLAPLLLIFGLVCLAGLGAIAFGAFLAWSVYRGLGLRVLAFADGFVHMWRGRTHAFRWDDITEVVMIPYEMGTSRTGRIFYLSYRIHRSDGHKVILDQAELPRADVLGAETLRQTARRLLPRLIAAFDGGESLTFGRLGSEIIVSQEGIRHGSKSLPWESIGGVQQDVRGGQLHIVLAGDPARKGRVWATLFLPYLPNPTAVVALVEHAKGHR